MRYLGIVLLLAASCIFSGVSSPCFASTSDDDGADFSRLLDYIAKEDLQDPLVLFQDQEGEFDRTLNRENIAYLNQNHQLLENIKTRLKGNNLHWKLAASSRRRLIVPEQRQEYADLFQGYCRKVIAYILDRLQSSSPYTDIVTLHNPLPAVKGDAGGGVRAYLVHNVADEYIEEYEFFDQDDDQTKIRIKLSNRVFSGIIGSYSSDLVIGENNSFEFVREPFTIWQNSAQNPLNVLIAPVEETLHILLRGATESAICAELKRVKPQKLSEVEDVVHDWMAVEESIVGGLVARLMPDILTRFLHDPKAEALEEALAQRDEHAQYRYLDRGIKVVVDLGLKKSVHFYKSDPMGFKNMVTHSDLAAASSHSAELEGPDEIVR